jgi:hypothetical protein
VTGERDVGVFAVKVSRSRGLFILVIFDHGAARSPAD